MISTQTSRKCEEYARNDHEKCDQAAMIFRVPSGAAGNTRLAASTKFPQLAKSFANDQKPVGNFNTAMEDHHVQWENPL